MLSACLGTVLLVILIGLAWRFSSRRASLPCPSWLAWMVELDNPLARSNNARTIIDRLELRPGLRVLDVGCGPGRLTIPLARRVGLDGRVVAIDIQPGMLRRAEEKAEAAGLTNIEFLQVGIGEGRLSNNQYDRAVLVTVLGEIPDRERALNEIFGLLKPGGILSITEIVFDPHYQSRKTVTHLAHLAGFREKAFFGNRLSFTINLEKPLI